MHSGGENLKDLRVFCEDVCCGLCLGEKRCDDATAFSTSATRAGCKGDGHCCVLGNIQRLQTFSDLCFKLNKIGCSIVKLVKYDPNRGYRRCGR